jgi:hypothetical protein
MEGRSRRSEKPSGPDYGRPGLEFLGPVPLDLIFAVNVRIDTMKLLINSPTISAPQAPVIHPAAHATIAR